MVISSPLLSFPRSSTPIKLCVVQLWVALLLLCEAAGGGWGCLGNSFKVAHPILHMRNNFMQTRQSQKAGESYTSTHRPFLSPLLAASTEPPLATCRRLCGKKNMAPITPLVVSAIAMGLALFECSSSASAFVTTTSAATTFSMRRYWGGGIDQGNRPDQQRCGASATTSPTMIDERVVDIKSKILQLAALVDRGGMANPGTQAVTYAHV